MKFTYETMGKFIIKILGFNMNKLFLPVKQWVTSSNAGILADSTISIKDSCQSHTASDLGMTYGLLPSVLTCATSMPNLASKKWTTKFGKKSVIFQPKSTNSPALPSQMNYT
jgi:hypothetical protein